MKLQNFTPFVGQHCETTATGTLLRHIGIELSEPMLFGLGEGLGFLFWNMKTMDFPFFGGRVKPDVLTENICGNLGLALHVKETVSAKKAWQNCAGPIQNGSPVGLKLDCYHLDYFSAEIHFAGHYVAMYGFDDEAAFLIDTKQQGGTVQTSLESLQAARSEKGPMASRNLSYTIDKDRDVVDLRVAIPQALKNNAADYLNPPITNLGYKGIAKASREIRKWFVSSQDVKTEFQTVAMLMEKAGTGGSLFRNLYRDFLKESAALLSSVELEAVHKDFVGIARQWKKVAGLLHRTGETGNGAHVDEASEVMVELSAREKSAMESIAAVHFA